jgi:hypothetical protein
LIDIAVATSAPQTGARRKKLARLPIAIELRLVVGDDRKEYCPPEDAA